MPSLESDCCPTKETPINRPLILSLNSIQPFISERSYRHQLVPCGNNFGNLLFSSAVQRLVQNAARAGRIGVDQRVMQETGADGLVIAAANWLQPKNDYSALASQIEKADVPIVVSGLGAQAIEDRLPELQPGTVRFLKIVSERSASISVRGHFTANLLEHYGITNVDVTGCPSLLWHLDRPARIRCMPDPERPLRISVNATVPGTQVPKQVNMRMRLAQVILGYSYRNDLDFVLQTEVPLLRAKTGEEDDEVLAYLDHVFQDAKREDYLKWVARRVKTFGLVGDWIAYCANQDIVVGSRLHGVIAGLLAGTPSILVTHDARTREMAEAAGIPNVSGEDVVTSGTLDPCAYLTEEAVNHFGARQMNYFAEFKAFWDRNGVPNVLSDLAGFPRPCRKHLA